MQLIELSVDSGIGLHVTISPWLLVSVVSIWIAIMLARSVCRNKLSPTLEFDEAEIGISGGKVRIKPDYSDIQNAYRLWVELKTRKLAIPIDKKMMQYTKYLTHGTASSVLHVNSYLQSRQGKL